MNPALENALTELARALAELAGEITVLIIQEQDSSSSAAKEETSA